MLRKFRMLSFLRATIALALVWAVISSFLFERLLNYLGLGWMSIEMKWSLFIGCNVIIFAVTVGVPLECTTSSETQTPNEHPT